MRTPLRLVFAAAALVQLSGCVTVTADGTYPVTDNSPNPAPAPGYKVQCTTYPFSNAFMFENVTSTCRSVVPATDEQVVVRARG